LQTRTIRQQCREPGAVERADTQYDLRVQIPGANTDRCVDAEPVPASGHAPHREPRPLFGRQRQPGTGELHDFDLAAEPVRNEGSELFGGTRPACEEPSIIEKRLDADGEPRHKMRRRVAGEGQQCLASAVGFRRSRRSGDFRRAVQPIFRTRTVEKRDEAVRQHVDEVVRGRRSAAQCCAQELGIGSRQDAGDAGEPDRAGRDPRRLAVGARHPRQDVGGRVGETRR
jgi:hypothetical protein